jgi:predicted RNase H-like HicB family nuclease
MRYPIAIEPGDEDTAFGVVVPDLPGCFSAGDTLDEAVSNTAQAISLWIECVLDDGGTVPPPAPLQTHRANPDFGGWIWALVEIDPALLSDDPEQVSVTLPARLVRRIDDYAHAHHETRSGFLARAAIGAMRPE